MKSDTTDVERRVHENNLSHIHARVSLLPHDGPELQINGDLKNKANCAGESAGLPPPNSSRSNVFPNMAQIVSPKLSSGNAERSARALPADFPAQPCIPSGRLQEINAAFKVWLVLLFLFTAIISFKSGEYHQRQTLLKEVKASQRTASALPCAEFPCELLPALDSALRLLREGENLEALGSLNSMLASHPNAPSLHYAAALAALQAGYPREAGRLADTSIKAGFRVSDSWALKAAIVAAQSQGTDAEQETLLKKAIASDPMNPAPFIELASLLRYQNKHAPAVSLLESAGFRLNPTDARTVVETTKAILAVEVAGDLAPPSLPLGIPAKDIPNAYSEMKRGNFGSAAAILRFCREQTSLDLFSYLVNDPALRKFASRPELTEFY